MSKNVSTIDDSNFDAAVATGFTAVKFTAGWCPPCHMLAPILESVAEDLAGRVKFHEIDSDANQVTSSRFGVRGLPTTILFRDGKPVDAIVGLVPKDRLRARIDDVIAREARK